MKSCSKLVFPTESFHNSWWSLIVYRFPTLRMRLQYCLLLRVSDLVSWLTRRSSSTNSHQYIYSSEDSNGQRSIYSSKDSNEIIQYFLLKIPNRLQDTAQPELDLSRVNPSRAGPHHSLQRISLGHRLSLSTWRNPRRHGGGPLDNEESPLMWKNPRRLGNLSLIVD